MLESCSPPDVTGTLMLNECVFHVQLAFPPDGFNHWCLTYKMPLYHVSVADAGGSRINWPVSLGTSCLSKQSPVYAVSAQKNKGDFFFRLSLKSNTFQKQINAITLFPCRQGGREINVAILAAV